MLFDYFLHSLSFVYTGLLIWMLIDCFQREQDRPIWFLVMLILHPLGLIAYFCFRFLPRQSPGYFRQLTARFSQRETKRLKMAALQIGNPYHWIQFADHLREQRQFSEAEQAYEQALEQEPDNLQALWGMAATREALKKMDQILPLLETILTADPQYKFGDVSLARGRILVQKQDHSTAVEHLRQHINRWRQTEALYWLAVAEKELEQSQSARQHLEELLMDLEASPLAIARKQASWKRKAKSLLKTL